MCIKAVKNDPNTLKFVPDHFKTQGMCKKAFEKASWVLKYVPDCFKTQKMYEKAVKEDPNALVYTLDYFKTQRLFEIVIDVGPWQLGHVLNQFKTQKMCKKAVKNFLHLIPDWFATKEWIDIWYDNNYWDYDNSMTKWYDGYKKRETQKAQIKKELMRVSWHPSRYWDWCTSEDEKKETEKLWA